MNVEPSKYQMQLENFGIVHVLAKYTRSYEYNDLGKKTANSPASPQYGSKVVDIQ